MKKIFFIFFFSFCASVCASVASSQDGVVQHYKNPEVNPDPNYIPPDYPLPDVKEAEDRFDQKADALKPSGTVYWAGDEEGDEISWTAIKNETGSVLGYFRNFDGYIAFEEDRFSKAELLIDVNSLDSTVPARDNRIKAIFFQSTSSERGTARLLLDKIEEKEITLSSLKEGSKKVTATGPFTLGGTTVSVSVKLEVGWDEETDMLWIETVEPLSLLISDLNLQGKVPQLMKECNHASLGNQVKISCKLHFE